MLWATKAHLACVYFLLSRTFLLPIALFRSIQMMCAYFTYKIHGQRPARVAAASPCASASARASTSASATASASAGAHHWRNSHVAIGAERSKNYLMPSSDPKQ